MHLHQIVHRHRGKILVGSLLAIGMMLLILVNGKLLFFATMFVSADKSQNVIKALHLRIPDVLAVPDVVDTLVENFWDRGSQVLMENLMQRDPDLVANYAIRKAKRSNSAPDKCRLLYMVIICNRSRAGEFFEKSWFVDGVTRSERVRAGFESLLRSQKLISNDEFDPVLWAQLVEDYVHRPEAKATE